MKFSSASEALDWAEKVWSIREGGRTTYREQYYEGGVPKDYSILDAITIRALADRACIWGTPCPFIRWHCLQVKLVPDPLVREEDIPRSQEDRINDCEGEFVRLLKMKGYL